jgi:hypothetical protein
MLPGKKRSAADMIISSEAESPEELPREKSRPWRHAAAAGPGAPFFRGALRHQELPGAGQGKMINLDEFRSGQWSVPFCCGDEIPECCFMCVYLLYDETDACLCDSQFSYFCGSAWPDRLTHVVPPCLQAPG